MNYKRIYDEIIERAKLRGLNKRKLNYYTEKHHIIPRSMMGSNDLYNLVLLTAREHFICHQLLWKVYKNKETMFAFYCMSKMKHKRNKTEREQSKLTSVQYELIKKEFSNNQKKKITSEETKLKISAAAKRNAEAGIKRKIKRKFKAVLLKVKIKTQIKNVKIKRESKPRTVRCKIKPKFSSHWSLI